MSRENVELARRGYELLNAALRAGELRDLDMGLIDQDFVLTPSGVMPESSEMHGHDGHVLTAGDSRWTRLDMYRTESEALKAVGLGD